jgi:hypothetical protein
MGNSLKSARFLVESRLHDAARGDAKACFDLGIVYSSGAEGIDVDLSRRTNGSTSPLSRAASARRNAAPRSPRT